jgi:hypothetical protein
MRFLTDRWRRREVPAPPAPSPVPAFDLADAVAEFQKEFVLGLTVSTALCVRSRRVGGFRSLDKLEAAHWLWRYVSKRSQASVFSEQLVAVFEFACRAAAEERPGVVR